MRNELAKLKDLKVGTARGNEGTWPSSVLHELNQRMEDGLDARRLLALADLIEPLPMAPLMRGIGKHWANGPIVAARYMDGRTPVIGYVLRESTEKGFGLVEFEEGKNTGAAGYWLTGYGLVCWGWGEQMGMAAVAGNGMVQQLQQVLTADPIWQRKFTDLTISKVTPVLIAQALRHFVQCRDATIAWGRVANEQDVAGNAPKVTPITGTTVVERPQPKAKLTGGEEWRTLMMTERYADLVTLCEKREADIQERIDKLLAEQKVWGKRRKSAAIMLDED